MTNHMESNKIIFIEIINEKIIQLKFQNILNDTIG